MPPRRRKANERLPASGKTGARSGDVRREGPLIVEVEEDDAQTSVRALLPTRKDRVGFDTGDEQFELDLFEEDDDAEMEMEPEFAEFQPQVSIDQARKALCIDKEDYVPGLLPKLFPHQVVGIHEMLRLENDDKHKGGILADEPGLGKTIQILGMITTKYTDHQRAAPRVPSTEGQGFKQTRPLPSLVIAPLSLHSQWKMEAETKTSMRYNSNNARPLKCLIHHGRDRTLDERMFNKYDLVITNLETLASEFAKKKEHDNAAEQDEDSECSPNCEGTCHKAPLLATRWGRLVIDEAHCLRNRECEAAKAVFKIDADSTWCLTGTPIVNKLDDLFPLFKLSGSGDYCALSNFRRGIIDTFKSDPDLACKRARAAMQPFTIRRLQSSEIDGQPILPPLPIEIKTVYIELNDDERRAYDAVESRARVQVSPYFQPGSMIKPHCVFFQAIASLRQVVLHPQLLKLDHTKRGFHGSSWLPYEVDKSPLDPVRLTMSEPAMEMGSSDDDHGFGGDKEQGSSDGEPVPKRARVQVVKMRLQGPPSTKMNKTVDLIRDINDRSPEEKILIFSNSVGFIDLLSHYLSSKGIQSLQYTGRMSAIDRENVTKTFNEPAGDSHIPRVLLLSVACAGYGLNLATANHVILTDTHWNPTRHRQAIGRAHRIGQTRTVLVYHIIARDTIEQRIRHRQQEKEGMASQALGEGESGPLVRLTIDEIRDLLAIPRRPLEP